jgi:hypothetical protein
MEHVYSTTKQNKTKQKKTKYHHHMKQATYNFVYCNLRNFYEEIAIPWFRQLVSVLSLHRHGFNPKASHVGFVKDRVLPKYFSFTCQEHSTNHLYSHSTSLTYLQFSTTTATNNTIKKH